MKMKFFLAFSGILTLFVMSMQAEAIPAFARANNLPCASCHSAFPSLNAFGRLFKTRGYRLEDASKNTKTTDFVADMTKLPIAAAIISRPYSKTEDEPQEIRAIHELELFTGGIFYKNLSGLAELEAESEDGFGGATELTALNYDFNDALHVQMAYAPTFFADPYDTLSNTRDLMVAPYNILSETFGGADLSNILQHPRQQVSLFGRIFNNQLFYNIGVGGLPEQKVGSKSTVGFGRLAYDITPSIMVGAFGITGTCDAGTTNDDDACGPVDLDFSRVGVDFQADVGNFRITGAYMNANDDTSATTDESNQDSYIQAVYYGNLGGNQIVPLLRYQTSQINDGNDETRRYVAGLTYYMAENFKGSIEYSDDTSTPNGVDSQSNFSLQLTAAF